MPLSSFDPLVREWFENHFQTVTQPQRLGWPEIRSQRDVLISAPTGSGKTLAAFLLCLDDLVRGARENTLTDETRVLYVSPLKALSNDIRKNLEIPLSEIAELALRENISLPPIRSSVRTGDTPVWERQQMVKRPPHILVTTPESLFILLTAEKSRQMLRTVRTVIVDEIHAIADDKRGSHLMLSLARLDRLTGNRPQRIGLSATVKPIEEVARFLVGSDHEAPARVINIGHRREIDLAVEVPKDELGPVASNEMWDEIYDRLCELIREHRTTLVFVNTRRLSERVAHQLAERLGEDMVLPHHGSLSTRLRHQAEERLKNGQLRAVVATASLELGIDIGTVDLVCQVGSPRSIAVALQRIGRSGHWVGALPKGRLIATTRDELIECAALVKAIRSGDLDRIAIPDGPLDILAQQMVAASASEEWGEDELFAWARRTYPYRALERKDFDALITMLSDGITTARGRSGAFLHRDQVNGRVRGRRGARLAAITSGGAIPDSANYHVIAEPEGAIVGTLDEDFAVESLAGDIFLLGTTSWRIKRVETGRVRVENAHGAAPSIPFWRGEAPGRTIELSEEVSRVREEIAKHCSADGRVLPSAYPEPVLKFLMQDCGLDQRGAEQAIDYIKTGQAMLGTVPVTHTVVAERFFDEAGGMQLVLHAPFGARVNRAWGLALRKRFCRSFNFELQAAATDNGIVISLSEQHAFPLDIIFGFLHVNTVEHVLTQALLDAPMFTVRWRWNASRALAILRFAGGKKVAPPIQRIRSDDLLAAVFPDQAACAENLQGEIKIPNHPLVNETIANCLHEAMDLEGLKTVLNGIANGDIRTIAIDNPEPSLFAYEILNANPYAYLDDAPLEERRARAVQLRRTLGPDLAGGIGALDPKAIAQVVEQSQPEVRSADELHDALLTFTVMIPESRWEPFFNSLLETNRATSLFVEDRQFWTPAERLDTALALYAAVYPAAKLMPPVASVQSRNTETGDNTPEANAALIVRGWLESVGPINAAELAAHLALPEDLINRALAQLEAEGQVLRGHFRSAGLEWCNRRLLARIHRLTIGALRREVEPVNTAQFVRFLCGWQHLAPGTQLHGVDGTLQIIKQLQGYEISAAAWESRILPRRVARYHPHLLDTLCLSGEVMWGRLSPHPAFESADRRQVRPTRVAPLAIFRREDAEWLTAGGSNHDPALSHPAQDVFAELERRGASFFSELVRGTGRLPSEVEDGLWELVAAGLVTADGFENLRSLIATKRRRGEGRARQGRPRHAAGRWAMLKIDRASGHTEHFAEQLLLRWGVIFRDLLARETLAPAWRDLLAVLRRMEAKGEIRGGRFVSGPSGEQFARPEAVDLLRMVRRTEPKGEKIDISLADPLNLAGIVLPGPRTNTLSGGELSLRDGILMEPIEPVYDQLLSAG